MQDARHRTYDVLGNLVRFLAFPDETNGKYSLTETIVPKGMGAPPHTHPGEVETFYVLEGEIGFMLDGEEMVGRAGDTIVIPDGAVHAFQGIAERSRALIVDAPGTLHEEFFLGVGTPLPEDAADPLPPSGPPDVAALVAMAGELGMTIFLPEGASA